MNGTFALVIATALALAAPARAEEASNAYPVVLGDHVDPAAHAHWPVRVRSLDRIAWRFTEGEHAGMAVPGADGLLYIQAGGGGIRGVDASTGKTAWLVPGNTQFFNYPTWGSPVP